MGREKVDAIAYVDAEPGTELRYGLREHCVEQDLDEEHECTAAQWAACIAGARSSQRRFDQAARAAFGAWYGRQTPEFKTEARRAFQAIAIAAAWPGGPDGS